METFIIQGGSLLDRQNHLLSKSANTELIHLFAEKTSISLKQVQDLSAPLSISPQIARIIWIEEANLLTIPAQNALLKMLEEPPEQTSFYLTVKSKSSLLATIQSRALIISLDQTNIVDDPSVLQELKTVMLLSPGDRLANITKRDREETKQWLAQIEGALKSKLKDSQLNLKSAQMLAKLASLTLSAHSQLDANCSVSLVTQNYYLLLPHTRSPK